MERTSGSMGAQPRSGAPARRDTPELTSGALLGDTRSAEAVARLSARATARPTILIKPLLMTRLVGVTRELGCYTTSLPEATGRG